MKKNAGRFIELIAICFALLGDLPILAQSGQTGSTPAANKTSEMRKKVEEIGRNNEAMIETVDGRRHVGTAVDPDNDSCMIADVDEGRNVIIY